MKYLNTTLKKTTVDALGRRRNVKVNEIVREYAHCAEKALEEKRIRVKISLADDVYNMLEQLSEKYGVPISRVLEVIIQCALNNNVVDKFYAELKNAIAQSRVYDVYESKLDRTQALTYLRYGKVRIRAKINITPEELAELEKQNVVRNARKDGNYVEFEPGAAFDISRLDA